MFGEENPLSREIFFHFCKKVVDKSDWVEYNKGTLNRKEVCGMGKDYNEIIKRRGMKKSYIAEKMGISQSALSNRLNGRVKFTKSEEFYLNAILEGRDQKND